MCVRACVCVCCPWITSPLLFTLLLLLLLGMRLPRTESFSSHYDGLRRGTAALATIDCLLSLARTAALPGYVRPVFVPGSSSRDGGEGENATKEQTEADDSSNSGGDGGDDQFEAVLEVEAGRHPMVSAALDEQFVPNSTHMTVQCPLHRLARAVQSLVLLCITLHHIVSRCSSLGCVLLAVFRARVCGA